MSDNPLADWLRARQDAVTGTDKAGMDDGLHDGATEGAGAGWPEWESFAAGPEDAEPAEPAPWERPPEHETDAPPRRRRLLLLAAALPWAVAVGLAVAAFAGDPAPRDGQQPVSAENGQPASAEDVEHRSAEGERPGSAGPSAPTSTSAGSPGVEPALGAAAALAVRLSVTTTEAEGDGEGPRRYVDLAVPDGVQWADDVAVVTVTAVVLEGSGERWDTVRAARFAVPVQVVEGQPVAVGDPWPVAVAVTVAEAPRWEPRSADGEGVTRALEAAGYTGVDRLEVDARASSHADRAPLLRARMWALAPGDSAVRDHQVWLRAEPEPAVLGAER
ncbi:MAG TPA: hypothetical protein VM287_10490 [Egibacteraceae bacterium]|nr:hypothetical protein [Egibacteraceae bacterium]